jgi:hypothetical protein
MAASFIAVIFFYNVLNSEGYSSYNKSSPGYLKPYNSTADLSYLSRHNLSPSFTYARRAIRTRHFHGERPNLSTMNETLLPEARTYQSNSLSSQQITDFPVLTLDVPLSPKVDTSIMSFGIATGVDRLEASIPQLSHWLSNTSCPVQVVSPPHESTQRVQSLVHSTPININLTITTSELPFVKAYFSLVKHLYESRKPETQWLVLIDDDTFFPSLQYLVAHLNEMYDATKPQLIAAMSDDLDQIRQYGLIPFGGGGIFMSLQLAKILASPEVYDKCAASPKNQGDQIFNDCLNLYTDVKPIFDHGLNQMDIFESPDGYFESGRRMLTVHHWKSWFHVDVPAGAKVTRVCGDEGLYMRWKFDDVVLSNGFSVVKYTNPAEVDLAKVEKTWKGDDGRWMHHIGPLRERLGGDKKKSYKLVETEVLEGFGVRQIYLHRGGENGVDGVVELLWWLA